MDYGIDEYGARSINQLMEVPFPISVTVVQPQIVPIGFAISGFPNQSRLLPSGSY
jgi:hypothetical protein